MANAAGTIKHNVESGEVAIRTIFPEDETPQLAAMAWLVATQNIGARHTNSAEVASWTLMYTPPEPTTGS